MAPKARASISGSTKNIDESIGMLCSVTNDLRSLESNLLSIDNISLQWCCQATHFLNTIHSHFSIFTQKSENPTSFWEGGTYLNLYMQETLTLLDLLNLIKLAISAMVRYRLIAEFTAQKLLAHSEYPNDAEIKCEVERLEGESRQLYGVQRWKDIDFKMKCSPKVKGNDLNVMHVANVFRTIMAVISMLLFSVMFYPVSVEVDQKVFDQFPQLKSISTSLKNIVYVLSHRLHQIQDHSRPVLVEYKMTEKVVMHMKGDILHGDAMDTRFTQKNSDLLQNSSMVLRNGLQLFENAVNEFFDEVTRGRNRLLGLCQQHYH
ncbi:PREDICTED: uncharacterized protein LOC109353887 [Lupinus angustifolius]|uniref:uncharacterized protein LOC109353887 n=1 Tax=Lupinus angustifolius TaxID=3871 RepID=UPI00092F739C|nr:PREDICTED: uncharacterized protein LOC109353887 [Lupinus angustifolius]